MNARERLTKALEHQEADRVPFDLGGSVVSGINRNAYRNLRQYLDLPPVIERITDAKQQIAAVDEDMRTLLGVDVREISPNAAKDDPSTRMEVSSGYTQFFDEWGIGWKMPLENGLYYDMFHHPLADARTVSDLINHHWPHPSDPSRFTGLRERAIHAWEEEKNGVLLANFCSGLFETATWLCGFEKTYQDLVLNPRLIESLLDILVELKIAYWERALKDCSDFVHAIYEADDLGSQNNLLISPSAYRKMIKPRHKRLFDFIHSRTNARIFFHSCGSVRQVIPDLIEIGVDILNPVQISAQGMDPRSLKKEFGRDLTFWGGGVDTQNVLEKGTPEQVQENVRENVDALAPGGGFVFAAVHNIQGNVPPENIQAMWMTLQEYGIYTH